MLGRKSGGMGGRNEKKNAKKKKKKRKRQVKTWEVRMCSDEGAILENAIHYSNLRAWVIFFLLGWLKVL